MKYLENSSFLLSPPLPVEILKLKVKLLGLKISIFSGDRINWQRMSDNLCKTIKLHSFFHKNTLCKNIEAQIG